MLRSRRDVESRSERQTTSEMCRLKMDEGTEGEGSRVPMWETNKSIRSIQTCHTISDGGQLFRNRAMTNDHPGDGRRVVGANKEAARCGHDIR